MVIAEYRFIALLDSRRNLEGHAKNRWQKMWKKNAQEKKEPGRFAEGPRYPGLSCPPPQ
jgi:hypothetical protein